MAKNYYAWIKNHGEENITKYQPQLKYKNKSEFVWLRGWKIEIIDNGEVVEKWVDKKKYFSSVCSVERVEKLRD